MSIAVSTAFAGTICLAFTAIWAGMMDLTTMKIRNEIVVFLLASYAALAPLAGFSLLSIGLSFLAALAILACMIVFFSFGWIGGGDAKLMTVIVLWLGVDHLVPYVLATTIAGGLLTLGIILFRITPLPGVLARIPWLTRLHSLEAGIPYGIAIAAGALIVLPQTPWMTGVV